MKKDKAYIKHMLEATKQIKIYIDEVSYEEFEKDSLRQDGVIRQIEILGEAANQISENLKEEYPEIPWKDVAGMRNKLIHGYFEVDLETVWNTVKNDLPRLRKDLQKIDKEKF